VAWPSNLADGSRQILQADRKPGNQGYPRRVTQVAFAAARLSYLVSHWENDANAPLTATPAMEALMRKIEAVCGQV
jgi:hypothetical protein